MTLSVPSFLAALTRASMPPSALAEVAVAASAVVPLPEPPPLEPPQAVRASAAVTATTAARRVLRRTCPPVGGAAPRQSPDGPDRAAWPIVADGARAWAVALHERDLTVP